jgi:hypothetical protein
MEFDLLSNGGKIIFELHHVWSCTLLHEHNKVDVSLLDLWFGYICIEKDHEPWDGGGPIWCILLKRKCQRSS